MKSFVLWSPFFAFSMNHFLGVRPNTICHHVPTTSRCVFRIFLWLIVIWASFTPYWDVSVWFFFFQRASSKWEDPLRWFDLPPIAEFLNNITTARNYVIWAATPLIISFISSKHSVCGMVIISCRFSVFLSKTIVLNTTLLPPSVYIFTHMSLFFLSFSLSFFLSIFFFSFFSLSFVLLSLDFLLSLLLFSFFLHLLITISFVS